MLYVTHFDLVFNLNPEQTGRIVLGISLLLGAAPYCYFFYHSVNECLLPPPVAYLMGQEIEAQDVTAMQIYGNCWLCFNVILLMTAIIFIPRYIKRHQIAAVLAAENTREELKTASLARIFLCSIILLCISLTTAIIYFSQSTELAKNLPVPFLNVALFVCVTLVFLILDENIKVFVKQKVVDQLQNLQISNRFTLFGWHDTRRINPLDC